MKKVPDHYPRSELRYGERPIRILDTLTYRDTQKCIPHRCFKFPVRALNAAAAMTNWLGPVRTLEVYNSKTGRLVGSFRIHADGTVTPYIDRKYPGLKDGRA